MIVYRFTHPCNLFFKRSPIVKKSSIALCIGLAVAGAASAQWSWPPAQPQYPQYRQIEPYAGATQMYPRGHICTPSRSTTRRRCRRTTISRGIIRRRCNHGTSGAKPPIATTAPATKTSPSSLPELFF